MRAIDELDAAYLRKVNGHDKGLSTCLTRCQDDEPVFVLVGRDPAAAETIRDWATRREIMQAKAVRDGRLEHGSQDWQQERAKIAEARALAQAMEVWQVSEADKRINAQT